MDRGCARPGRVGRRGSSVAPRWSSARASHSTRPRLAPWPPTGSNTASEPVARLSARGPAASTMPRLHPRSGAVPRCKHQGCRKPHLEPREFPCRRNTSFDSQRRNARSCQQAFCKLNGGNGVVCEPEVVRLGNRPPRDNPRVLVMNLSQVQRVVYQQEEPVASAGTGSMTPSSWSRTTPQPARVSTRELRSGRSVRTAIWPGGRVGSGPVRIRGSVPAARAAAQPESSTRRRRSGHWSTASRVAGRLHRPGPAGRVRMRGSPRPRRSARPCRVPAGGLAGHPREGGRWHVAGRCCGGSRCRRPRAAGAGRVGRTPRRDDHGNAATGP